MVGNVNYGKQKKGSWVFQLFPFGVRTMKRYSTVQCIVKTCTEEFALLWSEEFTRDVLWCTHSLHSHTHTHRLHQQDIDWRINNNSTNIFREYYRMNRHYRLVTISGSPRLLIWLIQSIGGPLALKRRSQCRPHLWAYYQRTSNLCDPNRGHQFPTVDLSREKKLNWMVWMGRHTSFSSLTKLSISSFQNEFPGKYAKYVRE